MLQTNQKDSKLTESDACTSLPPKWSVVIDDIGYSAPRQVVAVSVLKSQANVSDNDVLIRDYNSPNDTILSDEQSIDLAKGNVFYTQAKCDVQPREACQSPPKLAYFIDDVFEFTTNPNQTEVTLKGLFALPPNTRLIRDLRSPNDEVIDSAAPVLFRDGPVFFSRKLEADLRITINHRQFTKVDGVKEKMTGAAIAALVYPEAPRNTKIQLGEQRIGHDEKITIKGCEEFEVVRCNVKGGYELSRVQREVDLLRAGGASIEIVESPIPAIVYLDLQTQKGCVPAHTDVLVPIPSGYPSEIDWAYLPQFSPLIGRVQGSPQNHRIEARGKLWQQISYHPHRGGGAPPFNPTKHGFHTYISEVLSWLHQVQ